MSMNGTIKNITSQCQVVWYEWKSDTVPVQDPLNDSAESIAYDLSNHLTGSISFSKNIGSPAGNFSFQLDASRDWKDVIKKGSWCLIYMSNDGSLNLPEGNVRDQLPTPPKNLKDYRRNLRAICYIERVAVVGNTSQDTGSLDIAYEVSGRDFGVVYDETELWYNYFVFDEIKIAGLSALMDRREFNTAADQLRVVHDLFFAAQRLLPSEALGPNNSLTSIGQQWLLPKQMTTALGLKFDGTSTFYGNIVGLYDFRKTLVTSLIDNPLKFVQGKVWEKLKSLAVMGLHELFPELDDTGHPRLVYRPIPWGIDPQGYPKLAAEGVIQTYMSFATTGFTIEDAVDIVSFNLGEDNHARYNHFFLQIENDIIVLESTINILRNRNSPAGRSFPFMDQLSVQRHGFRPMHLKINSLPEKIISSSGENKDGYPNADLLLQYNELLFDYWQNAVDFESGTITIIGRPDVRVGKAFTLGPNVPHNSNKIFYIESYTDEFVIEDKGAGFWTQTLSVTRGVEKADLESLTGFAKRSASNTPRNGEYTHRG